MLDESARIPDDRKHCCGVPRFYPEDVELAAPQGFD